MKKLQLVFLLFTIATYAIATTPRLDAVEENNSKLTSKVEESEKKLMKQELNNKNLESKIDELKNELEKLKNTQDDYRIEKSSYDFKMQSNTDLIALQDKRIGDINFYFVFWGVLITIILLIVFFKAKQESRETAKETAQEFIDKWIEDKATPHLNKKISEVLQTKDDEIKDLIEGQIKERVEPLLSSIKASLKDVEADKDKAKIHIDELDKLSQKAKDIFKDIPAKEELEKIEAKEVTSLTSTEHYTLGVSALNENKLNTALNEFENSIRLSEKGSFELANSIFAKGYVLNELKEYDKAIEAYKKVVEINPRKDEAYNNMGSVYDEKEEYGNAIEAYQKAVEINPKNDSAYYNMGIAYNNNGEYGNAIEAYQKAVEINPKKDGAYNGIGTAYSNKGEYDNAIEAYQKAVEINPKKDGAYNGLGIVYGNKGEYDNAIEAYQKSVEINPKKDGTYTNLFELQLIQNQPFEQELEQKYIELFQNKKETFIYYDMLKILQNITHKTDKIEVNLEQWKQKYEGVELDWSFDELKVWIDGVEDSDVKARLQEALEVFKGHG